MKTHGYMIPLRNVPFPFLSLESTQSHSPGQQSPYRDDFHPTSNRIQTRILIHSRGGATIIDIALLLSLD